MAQQLQYTCVPSGATGRAGFQFTARSVGARPGLEQVIERFMTYRPPGRARTVEQCPVSLAYEVTPDGAVAVCCRYLGEDHTGRPGNFLGHAVVAATGELDGVRPIELWRAPFWATTPARSLSELPAADLAAGTSVDPERVAALLASAGGAGYDLLAALVDATRRTLVGQAGPVILLSDDVHRTALWIAAVSYSLPLGVARTVSFVTYTADPRASRHHLVGTTPQAWAAIRGDGDGFLLTPVRAPEAAAGPSPYAAAAAAAWRAGDLGGLDTLCATAAVATRLDPDAGAAPGGPLDTAAALVALCRGQHVDERYHGTALRVLAALPAGDRARLRDGTAASGGFDPTGEPQGGEPGARECLTLLETLGPGHSGNPAVREVVAGALSRAPLDDGATLRLAREVASRYRTGPERLVADARMVLAAGAVAEARTGAATPDQLAERLDRLAHCHPAAEPRLAARAVRHAADALATLSASDRAEVLRRAAPASRDLLVTDWLEHTPDHPWTRIDLAEIAVRLRAAGVVVPPLTGFLLALLRRPFAFRRVHRGLQQRGDGLADDLRALVGEAGGGWRSVFRRPAGS